MKRIVSLVLILALVFTFGAGSAFAAGSSAGDTTATVMKIAGFEELLAADGTIITELTDIPITVVP